jgi:hypothetical protein
VANATVANSSKNLAALDQGSVKRRSIGPGDPWDFGMAHRVGKRAAGGQYANQHNQQKNGSQSHVKSG